MKITITAHNFLCVMSLVWRLLFVLLCWISSVIIIRKSLIHRDFKWCFIQGIMACVCRTTCHSSMWRGAGVLLSAGSHGTGRFRISFCLFSFFPHLHQALNCVLSSYLGIFCHNFRILFFLMTFIIGSIIEVFLLLEEK